MLIGSRAIAHWNPEFKVRSDSDWDIIGTPESEDFFRSRFSIPDEDKIEWHDPNHLNNKSMFYYFNTDRFYKYVINPYGLAVMYRSHLHRDYNWDASYNGAEYDSWSIVEPKQKTITVYS